MTTSTNPPRVAPLTVTGILFQERKKPGDFKWMVTQPAYDKCAFVIMENYIDMVREDSGPGGGTAALRPYTMYHQADGKPLRAMGIPTGWSSDALGFSDLDRDTKRLVDLSIQRIVLLLQTSLSHVTTLYFSCDKDDPCKIGTGIFAKTLHSDVIDYISQKLKNLPAAVLTSQDTMSLAHIRVEELKMLRTALLIDAAAEQRRAKRKREVTADKSRAPVAQSGKQPAHRVGKQMRLTHATSLRMYA